MWKLTRRLCLHNRYFPTLAKVVEVVEGQFGCWTQPNEPLRKLCAIAVGIIAVPSPDDEADHWWRYSEGVKDLISEAGGYIYAKLLFHPENQNCQIVLPRREPAFLTRLRNPIHPAASLYAPGLRIVDR